jgi:mannose/fructose/N-acetylgalactosamine-specific phosphotransferase system component IIC
MAPRKKKGIGFLVSGLVFLLVGGVFTWTAQTPEWLDIALQIIGALGNVLGFAIVFPDREK